MDSGSNFCRVKGAEAQWLQCSRRKKMSLSREMNRTAVFVEPKLSSPSSTISELFELLRLRHIAVTRIGYFPRRMKANLALGELGLLQHESSGLQSQGVPDDLRTSVSEHTLIRLALEAVQTVEWQNAASWPNPVFERTVLRPLLTTVLVYSYAAGVLASRDIEIRARHDRALCYLCRSTVPDRDTLRLFRRHHVQLVTQCLKVLLETVWKETRSNGSPFGTVSEACREPSLNHWSATRSEPDFAREAERRVTRAIQADSMAMDE
jgi:hypothetical protein